jgi:hypothetical protein
MASPLPVETRFVAVALWFEAAAEIAVGAALGVAAESFAGVTACATGTLMGGSSSL